ncbi:Fe2+-dependent dioxygenase [Synechococcus sp. CS-602]|uniref:Fe2+-dependent dioxygenase n=1 Tax=Synechococcaceae TaxID=1890426 RepID=UPI0008FF6345|nr:MULTISPECIES: Fe2+-dependent dioxygenase [Synechococcaceae]MCT4363843.1 Fe2+-dependent dioxygenase [Candidatus Regnicoccus frigidus MAG-AL1]APD49040.1 Fe2+-dependent dioxygenase [Synechococcus sp. SynAce01]MCT0201654.1 Fe2+-dependent dioxygenase [Synechococcus sp. CS-603]MCT0203521.1 Fe2+-dependent dioxygenase [Synechococcus sp. CS-602]MCT0246255.1 Fe2+-dependent dioxygenase [Synechococcus sp. CS-601]
MRFQIDSLLPADQLAGWCRRLLAPEADWRPGQDSAGWHARTVKHNRQLPRGSALHQSLLPLVHQALQGHPLLASAALPARIHSLRFCRSGPGEGYGRHVDNAYMAEGRSDLSFTLFLSEPDAYSDGELVLEFPHGEETFRLPAGDLIVYPSTLLHRVEPVSDGDRLVCVGWIQSRIRSAEQRELLFELDTARRLLFSQQGKGEAFDLISRSYSNLLRIWGD